MFTSAMPNFYSSDLAASMRFYLDLLGGAQTFRFPAEGKPRHVEFRFGDVVVAVTHRDEVSRQGLPAPQVGNPMELVVWCDSVDEAATKLGAAGAAVIVEPYDHPAGMRRAYIEDPDGNWVALVSEK